MPNNTHQKKHYGEYITPTQALERTVMPEQYWKSPFPLFVEPGDRYQPITPVNYLFNNVSALKIAGKELSHPSIEAALITDNPGVKEQDITNVLSDPRRINDILRGAIFDRKVRSINDVKSPLDKVAWLMETFIPSLFDGVGSEYHFIKDIDRVLSGEGRWKKGKWNLRIDESTLQMQASMIDDYIGDNIISTSTAKHITTRPIGLGGKSRFCNMSQIIGYKGTYIYRSQPEAMFDGRPKRNAAAEVFGAYHYMSGMASCSERGVITAAFLVDALLGSGLSVTNIYETIDLLPLFCRYNLGPSFYGLMGGKLPTFAGMNGRKQRVIRDMEIWIFKLHVFMKFVTNLKAKGVDTLIREQAWDFTGNTVPGDELQSSCLQRGLFKCDVPGVRSVYFYPADTSHLTHGELQIMSSGTRMRNTLFPAPGMQELKIRSTPIYVNNDKVLSVPHLVEEQCDIGLLAFEKSIDMAQEREIYHKEPFPPVLHVYGDWTLDFDYKTNPEDLLDCLMIGGEPLFTADVLLKHYHEPIYVRSMNKTPFYSKKRKDEITDAEVITRMGQLQIDQSKRMYDGALNTYNLPTVFDTEEGKAPTLLLDEAKNIKDFKPSSKKKLRDMTIDDINDILTGGSSGA